MVVVKIVVDGIGVVEMGLVVTRRDVLVRVSVVGGLVEVILISNGVVCLLRVHVYRGVSVVST